MSTVDYKHLQHMLEAANAALVFVQGRNRERILNDRSLMYALVRAIELVSETSDSVSLSARAQLSAIPWDYVTNLAAHICHGDDINLSRVWEAVDKELPVVVDQLSQVVTVPGA